MFWVIFGVAAVIVVLALGLRRVRRAPSLSDSTRADIANHETQAQIRRGADRLDGGRF
jgi:hypothetical protein